MADALGRRPARDAIERWIAIASRRAGLSYDDGPEHSAAVAGAGAVFGAFTSFIYFPALAIAFFIGAVGGPAGFRRGV
jgi:hypothetical protein